MEAGKGLQLNYQSESCKFTYLVGPAEGSDSPGSLEVEVEEEDCGDLVEVKDVDGNCASYEVSSPYISTIEVKENEANDDCYITGSDE